MSDDFDLGDYFQDREERPRDSKVDEARAGVACTVFPGGWAQRYYGRQLEVALERQFFHWITKKALNELAQEGRVKFAEEKTGLYVAHFYWSLCHR